MIPTIVIIISCILFETWVRDYYTPRKIFKDTSTQTEFRDLYPDFFESLSDPDFFENSDMFDESSSEQTTLSDLSVEYEMVPDDVRWQTASPTSTQSSTDD